MASPSAPHLRPTASSPPAGRPLVIGEVLFDVFAGGTEVLGGAPFNVAWHLQGFGLDPLVMTAVGDDPRGHRVREAMGAWGMDLSGVQVHPDRPTGVVAVTLDGGAVRFDIRPDQAYDDLHREPVLELVDAVRGQVLYHGSLIARCRANAALLSETIRRSAAPVFVDVNLRPPWWQREAVEALLRGARWAKVNEDELGLLSPSRPNDPLEARAQALRERFGLAALVVTLGADGALVATDGIVSGRPPPIARLVDTVGAGDAFSAVALAGLIHDWPWDVTLPRALAFAADVCGQRGATAPDPALYRRHLERWQGEATEP